MNKIRTCVTPEKQFLYGIHQPSYTVSNIRGSKKVEHLGTSADAVDNGLAFDNRHNFPDGSLTISTADRIFEIPNPLPFRGTTFINQEWADASAADSRRFSLPKKEQISLRLILQQAGISSSFISKLPSAVLLALATCSSDPQDLIALAELSCQVERDAAANPVGLFYRRNKNGRRGPIIHDHALFEAVANNPNLPDSYKKVMVVRPGAQGDSEIVGEYHSNKTHVFEYLRRNSYIANGHYAANMADDAIRYSIQELAADDMQGLRHLYYQRTYIRLAEQLGLDLPVEQQDLSPEQLESLRQKIRQAINNNQDIASPATLWGWNFGFDYAPSGYRLHASHQQIHQQYALIPGTVSAYTGDPETSYGELPAFGCGDMVAEVISHYREQYHSDFFADYIGCIRNNRRMDGRKDRDNSLVVWEDEQVMLFVPKAQTSQWELQLMALHDRQGMAVGNILEADPAMRFSLDKGILLAQKILAALGAAMVTSIEYPKRIGRTDEGDQHLLYAFLPRLPESPGAFSEAQLRFINGHYPEDFAAICRQQLATLGADTA